MEDTSRYYTLVKDPARRKIVQLLGEQDKLGFKDLKENLQLGVGTIYYHLDMLSDYITQDEHRKYMLNHRGKLLYRTLKNGTLPPTLEVGKALSHHIGRWIFLSPIFTKTTKPERMLPLSLLILIIGALGSAQAKLDPLLFFYFPFSAYQFETIIALFLTNWIGLYLLSNLLIYLLYKRTHGNLQLLTSLGIAALPLAIFPYLHTLIPPETSRYLLLALQIWTLPLLSSAYCFGKGIRLDKSIIITLTILYLNVTILILTGRLM
jgi:DNA-binding transcriptional ArsR family regulator